ncbi:MAG: radical SAM family heme chaperone HemW [Proteobacteria bacterium]|nr:radical SAM family heme chaperone HemW [Pseudomonadota bacterium]
MLNGNYVRKSAEIKNHGQKLRGVYIHIPFCKRRCNYCGFYSNTDTSLIKGYTQALMEEFENKKRQYADFFKAKEATLFIGGGNPALLSLKDLEKILKTIYSSDLAFDEITIEANPDSLGEEKISSYKNLGINRISLGIQSFDDSVLNLLGRNHSSLQALKSLEIVKKHFDNFSVDIIGGIYGEFRNSKVKRDISHDLKFLAKFSPPHISFYLLSIEEGSFFFNKFVIDEAKQAEEYNIFCEFARDKGYTHYEVSNFAKKGYECKHNKIYWEGGEFIGLGPSAVSFLKENKGIKNGWGIRLKNVSDIKEYIKNVNLTEMEYLDRQSAFCEAVFLPLRTSEGLNLSMLKLKFPEETEKIYGVLENLKKAGFVEQKKGQWIIPEKHFIIGNEIVAKILKGAGL